MTKKKSKRGKNRISRGPSVNALKEPRGISEAPSGDAVGADDAPERIESLPDDISELAPKPTAFASHASEDKGFVKQMVDMLIRSGIDTWYDQYEIRLGDSIRQKVNEGLRKAQFGIVVLSENFYAKGKTWTHSELDALWEGVEQGNLIPVLHQITPERLKELDPLFGGRLALLSENDPILTASSLAERILGSSEQDEEGRQTFRGKTLRLPDLAFSEGRLRRITNTRFVHCVLLGPVILINVAKPDGSDGVFFSRIPMQRGFWNKFNEVALKPYGTALVGGVGVRNVVFEDCHFKDVGFIVSSVEKHGLQMNFKQSRELALWPVRENPLHSGRGNGLGGPLDPGGILRT